MSAMTYSSARTRSGGTLFSRPTRWSVVLRADEHQLRPPRPDGVLKEDVSLEPDGGRLVETAVAGAAGVAVEDGVEGQEQTAGQQVESERQPDGEEAAADEPAPVERLLDGHLFDALGGLVDGLLDHGRRIALGLGLPEVGQFDGSDEAVAEQAGEAPFQHQGERGIAKVAEQPAEHADGHGVSTAPATTTSRTRRAAQGDSCTQSTPKSLKKP